MVYIVIDGVDEIEEGERSRLLEQLLRVSKNCQDCRILLGSRSESDLITILKDDTVKIEVHHRNSGGVQVYVKHRMAQLFRERAFVPEFQAEIERSLARLAHIAKGMSPLLRVRLTFFANNLTYEGCSYMHE